MASIEILMSANKQICSQILPILTASIKSGGVFAPISAILQILAGATDTKRANAVRLKKVMLISFFIDQSSILWTIHLFANSYTQVY